MPGLRRDEKGCMEFNILISQQTGKPPSLRLNVKVRQHLEDALTYLSQMFEICVFTAGEKDYAEGVHRVFGYK